MICEALNKSGKIPDSALKNIKKKAKFDEHRIDEIEKEVKHDVIAFLTNLAENIGEDARFIHQGVTSSDILDTCLSIQIKQSLKIIIPELKKLINEFQLQSNSELHTMTGWHGVMLSPATLHAQIQFSVNGTTFRRELIPEQVVCSIPPVTGKALNGPLSIL